jgi:altronate dehydratase
LSIPNLAVENELTYNFDEVARLPSRTDNVAIATRTIEAGLEINSEGERYTLSHTVLEGHRFAVKTIDEGESLLSWGLTFGISTTGISPGDYICNSGILDALALRNLEFELPSHPNFRDEIAPYVLDEDAFQPGVQVPLYNHQRFFAGHRRAGNRGVGTRNYIVVMGTTSRTSSFAKTLADRFKDAEANYENIDGIVAVGHTEGGEEIKPNNLDILLRTLGGFIVHPNVGAILVLDYGTEAVTNKMLEHYVVQHCYPIHGVRHRFLTLQGGFNASLEKGEAIINGWLKEINAADKHTKQPVSNLKIALQCGGSDAFSGVSGNPLAAHVANEIIRYGGCANLAETDELIGAEEYVLQTVKDLETAHKFLDAIERFKERARWHGHTVEANPSGGNKFRGLYNIVIKSIGAAMKRHPDVRLDDVIDYGERMLESGFYFMDSPGNDLESIAGQVASGANLIFFVTGNGSITNFPFVPTIKIVTTTGRYNLLANEMDVNAGAYLDGVPMAVSGQEMFDLTLRIAGGEQSVGEKARHSQVSIWRNWRQTRPTDPKAVLPKEAPDGKPLSIRTTRQPTSPSSTLEDEAATHPRFNAIQTKDGYRSDQIGLVLPTSLCSGQIALMIADRLNRGRIGKSYGISRFVALPHTEGCGVSGGNSEDIYARTLIGHLTHPIVGLGMLLEHGCEKTHNDYIADALTKNDIPIDRYGWASVQLDGGIEAAIQKVEYWFGTRLESMDTPHYTDVGLEHLCLGLMSVGKIADGAVQSLVYLIQTIVAAGGTVVVPANATGLVSHAYLKGVLGDQHLKSTLAYGQSVAEPGFHIMDTPTGHAVETLTGLGGTGVDVMFAHVVGHPLQSHRMIPLLQATTDETTQSFYQDDLDLTSADENSTPEDFTTQMLKIILEVASRRYIPKLYGRGNTDFQFTRGLLGISM